MYSIIHINNDWYYDTINEVHVQRDGIKGYINSLIDQK